MVVNTDMLRETTSTIFNTMLGLDLTEAPELTNDDWQECLSGTVTYSGTSVGGLTLDCPETLAKQAAAIMFGMSEEETSEVEIKDTLGELANMTGGNLKSLLPGPTSMSTPQVRHQPESELCFPQQAETCQACFKCQGHALRVTLKLLTAN